MTSSRRGETAVPRRESECLTPPERLAEVTGRLFLALHVAHELFGGPQRVCRLRPLAHLAEKDGAGEKRPVVMERVGVSSVDPETLVDEIKRLASRSSAPYAFARRSFACAVSICPMRIRPRSASANIAACSAPEASPLSKSTSPWAMNASPFSGSMRLRPSGGSGTSFHVSQHERSDRASARAIRPREVLDGVQEVTNRADPQPFRVGRDCLLPPDGRQGEQLRTESKPCVLLFVQGVQVRPQARNQQVRHQAVFSSTALIAESISR